MSQAFWRLTLAHVCRKYMRFQANVLEHVSLAPKTRAIIQGNIATGSTIQRCWSCFIYNAVAPCGPRTQRYNEVPVYLVTVVGMTSKQYVWFGEILLISTENVHCCSDPDRCQTDKKLQNPNITVRATFKVSNNSGYYAP